MKVPTCESTHKKTRVKKQGVNKEKKKKKQGKKKEKKTRKRKTTHLEAVPLGSSSTTTLPRGPNMWRGVASRSLVWQGGLLICMPQQQASLKVFKQLSIALLEQTFASTV